MKNKLGQLLRTFTITLVVAFIATDQENVIYKIINSIGIENEIFKKTVLGAIITLIIGIISLVYSFLEEKLAGNFKKINVSVNAKINGTKKATIVFQPEAMEYSQEIIELEVNFNPGGRVTNWLVKKIGVSLDVYFNPEIIDISFLNDWDTTEKVTFMLTNRNISINLLEEVKIEGKTFVNNSHTLSEKFIVKPIRVKNGSTKLDLVASNKLISNLFIGINFESFKVTCKGE
ncbi:hypothetical protein ACTHQ4_16435 [Alkalicoccobacillus gibsonii]|uniref:hypothetical protein n=1 Tax=Alkalicoccobacillus gibsonii TaxID=79881 RepID=UPI003F7C9D26